MKPLAGKVCVVAGATRGAGRGIAIALGEKGATVYCTGRSTRGHAATPGRPETIEETAALVDAAGGHGIAARVDHLREDEVVALARRVRDEQGRLDVIVNDVWGGDALMEWGKPFWEIDAAKAFAMIETVLRTHLLTARHLTPLMIEREGGLLVEVTDGNAGIYRGAIAYDTVKAMQVRLAWGMDQELAPKGAVALAITPGFLRSEAMLAHFGVTEATWREGAAKDPHFAFSETPLFVGRAVASLAADPRVAKKRGRVWASWDLAEEYGFVDADGARPHWGRHFEEAFPGVARTLDEGFYAYWRGWETLREAL